MTGARVAAARVLGAVGRGHTTLAAELERHRRGLADDRDRALLFELTAGVLRWRNALDAVLAACTTRRRLDPDVRDVLRIGAYQLLHLDRIPPHAVVHESVELARTLGQPSAAGFVNAVLRRLTVDAKKIRLPSRPGPKSSRAAQVRYLSVTLSHPDWLAERWLERYGFDAAEAWCKFNNAPPIIAVRPADDGSNDLQSAFAVAGLTASPARWVRNAFLIDPNAGGLPPALADRLVIQDEASQVVAHALSARRDDHVLDICAAPGGKTLIVVEDMARRGVLVAADGRLARVRLLKRLLARSAASVPVLLLDAARPLPFKPIFDAVLLDAPCSGLGVIRRDPDIKWARTPDDLTRFSHVQRQMLNEAAAVVRPGGRLLYATCSSEPEENEGVVREFLVTHPEFSRSPAEPGPAVTNGTRLLDPDGTLRTLPFRDGLDAFCAALLVRRRVA